MGLKTLSEDCTSSSEAICATMNVKERPLYYWLKSFAEREISENADFSAFVSSNALTCVLEYIGINSENEQSSLHLSAIFEEENQQKKYPTHYESETKSRIQSLNRVFIELKSFFEDRYSQIVAIRPPNSVHITSSCPSCSIQEFEKLLFLLLGAAIQGGQKQDTIRTIKRFPSKIQESLIECIKLIADNPELLNVKPWNEFKTLGEEEQREIYEKLLSLIRKLILERNELTQNQLISDYFAGYTNCDQKRGYSVFGEYEKSPEDTRLSSSMRQLREQLMEKSELLQECREELEKARNWIHELEIEVNDMKQKHRAMKKARDELDALREGQDKAARLEIELTRLKAKMEESELVYERVEGLEIENKNWQVKHDMLLDQISFLSFEKSGRDNTFDNINDYSGILDGLVENLKDFKDDDDDAFFDSDNEEPSVKENLLQENQSQVSTTTEEVLKQDQGLNTSTSTIQPDSPPLLLEDKEEMIERPVSLDISQTESIDSSGDLLVASTPKSSVAECKPQEVQTPTKAVKSKRRRKHSLLNMKRNRKAIIIPILPGQKLPIQDVDQLGEDSPIKNLPSQTIQIYKVYNVDRRKGSSRPKKFKPLPKNSSSEKQVVPNIDNEGNEADEELSISPMGAPNLSDLDSNNDQHNGTDNDSEIYFVCSPQNSTGTNTPRRSQFGTTTAFPITNLNVNNGGGLLRRTEFSFDPQNLSNLHYQRPNNDSHSNHMTIYNREATISPNSTTTVYAHVPYSNNNNNNSNNNVSHDAQVGPSSNSHSGSDEVDHDDASDAFTFGDYNIQLKLRNSIKPALINKISTLSANPRPDHNFNNQYSSHAIDPYNVETSSEEDGSIWYEYGCV